MRTAHRFPLRSMVFCALFAALIGASAWIPPIPAGVISITFQTLAVYLTAGVLPLRWSFTATLLYLMLGAIGFPVFSGGQGGVGILFGATGGYLIGFLAISLTVGLGVRYLGSAPWKLALSMGAGTLICYLIGSIWYCLQFTAQNSTISFGMVLTLCVLPFLLPDLLKILLAVFIVCRLRKQIKFEQSSATVRKTGIS